MKQYEIWVAELPSLPESHIQRGRRPVIIVSNGHANAQQSGGYGGASDQQAEEEHHSYACCHSELESGQDQPCPV